MMQEKEWQSQEEEIMDENLLYVIHIIPDLEMGVKGQDFANNTKLFRKI